MEAAPEGWHLPANEPGTLVAFKLAKSADGLYYTPLLAESSSVRAALAGLIILEAVIVLDTVTRLSFANASTREHTLTPAIGMPKELHNLSAPNEALQIPTTRYRHNTEDR